ncbi:craniofacial development protein 2-like [Dreissena polymorpha]|uniref:craniofacial development protein 2-like n=1 Tax=Dreissena polymorpha TaxID=45954 RepID=UPI002263AF6B|nr:craniofacial development protein 2-like [Dreissena polymorpha]
MIDNDNDKAQNTKPNRSLPRITSPAHFRSVSRVNATRTTKRTWNVRTLNACVTVHELTYELERNRWEIIGLAEFRLPGFGETSTDEGHKILFSGEDSIHRQGVAFIVRKEVVNSVISCTPVFSRIISILISAKPHYITIIEIYAPTADYKDDEIKQFYEELERIIFKVPKRDILIVYGDWNTKTGPDQY